MKIDSIAIRNFRCFGPKGTKIGLESSITTFVGGNGSGKTAVFQALSRLFGVTQSQRAVRRKDFHIPADKQEPESGTTLSIEVILSFPELEDPDNDTDSAVPEFFRQMAASAQGAALRARMRLEAEWSNDGTPDGNVNEDIRWVTTLEKDFTWDQCERVQAVERGAIQLIYVPATRDAATQVTNLLKGRLWQAAKWSDEFRDRSGKHAQAIQEMFEQEDPTKFVIERLSKRWEQVNEADTDTTPVLRLVEHRLEELVRKAEFAFFPDDAGTERDLHDLSDGQRSLFHIALTAATLEVERDALAAARGDETFDRDKLRRIYLTLLAIEEPENSLSPFFLSRIVAQARDIGGLPPAQVIIASHSPAILSRIEPEEVRYFRLDRKKRRSTVKSITLPEDDQEASRYVRLAVRAYPELYFARFVILGEGDSERIVIPRIADAMGIQLDPSFVPIVPLGGRHVKHFWSLLNDLSIPYATLLDLDLGRVHGGANTFRNAIQELSEIGNDLSSNIAVMVSDIDLQEIEGLTDSDFTGDAKDNKWLRALQDEGVFFSDPIDLDFAMLSAFPKAYRHPRPGGKGPLKGTESIEQKKAVTLKTGGKPELFTEDFNEDFRWYPYLFLDRSKPETHLAALSRIAEKDLREKAPPELKALIKNVKKVLGT